MRSCKGTMGKSKLSPDKIGETKGLNGPFKRVIRPSARDVFGYEKFMKTLTFVRDNARAVLRIRDTMST